MANRAAVVGAGAWGSVFATILRQAGNDVCVWTRSPAVASQINDEGANPSYVLNLDMGGIRATTDLAQAVTGATLVALAVPSAAVRAVASALAPHLGADATVISLSKGLEDRTLHVMTQVIAQELDCAPGRIVALSGPNLSAEIAAGQLTGTVVAGSDPDRAAYVAARIDTPYFRPYVGSDVLGTEIGGVVKNIIALCVGACSGMKLGINTRSFIIDRGLMEMARLGIALGARKETFLGLAGLGDLVATCSSRLSRNFSCGYRVGQGMSVPAAVAASGTVEGVRACPLVLQLAERAGVEMPICQAAGSVIEGKESVTRAAARVFSTPRVTEGVDARIV